jgi:tetratricopeptide (TPR) repeat protein/transglutaminase-like putative cysteine protease
MSISSKTKSVAIWLVLSLAVSATAEDSFFDRQLDNEIVLLKQDMDKPEGFVRLYAIWDLVDFARWDGRVPNALSEVHQFPGASPLLKGHSLWLLREVDLRLGDFDGARQKQAQLGFVTDWLIIGPFDNEGMAGFDLTYPPEEELNLSETHDGKVRPVAWREYPRVSFDCYIDLAATFRPNSQTAAYALACVFSPQQQPIALRLGSDDCAKAWVAEQLVVADRDCHPIGFDQSVAPATLEKGWNKLLLKVCQDDDAWGFRLRLTRPDGGPLSTLRFAAGKAEVEKALVEIAQERSDSAGTARQSDRVPVADPIAAFREALESNPSRAETHADFSFLLSHANAYDRNTRGDIRELETAASLAPGEWKYHFRLGELYDDENKKRAAYEKTIELNPDCAPAYSRLGEYYAERNLQRKSVPFFREAIKKDPSFYPALLGLARYYHENSQKGKAAKLWKELLNAYPDAPDLRSRAVEFAPLPTTLQQTQEVCEAALRLNFSDLQMRNALLSNCHKRLDFEAALQQSSLIEQINPMNVSALLDHARLLTDHKRYDDAIALIDRALEICPEDDLALQQKGELLLQQKKQEEALSWLEKSFAFKPQNRPLREHIEFLKPKEKPFEDDYKADALTVIREAPSDIAAGGDSAVYLFDLWIRELHPNGLTNSYHQEIVRILSEAGIEAFRFRRAVYRPSTHEIQVKAARVFKKDGRVINAEGPFSYPLGGEDRMYYDLEAKYVRFANLEPGDTIEFSYRMNATTPRNMYGDYFGDIVYFKDAVPKKVMDYIVLAPPEKPLYYNVVGMDAPPEIDTRGHATLYRWKVRDIEKVESEPYMPGYSEVLPYVHISTYRDWESVGEWYWNLIRDQFLLHAGAKAQAVQITAGLQTEREKIVAIHNYVVQNTRYIGLEFGIHGHKPYPAYKVYARKFGDCKDKAGLMIAMLKEIGVDACMVAIRIKSRGRIEPEPASLAVFNHAICYVPKYDLWLDGTAEYSGTGELPYEDQGTCALVVGKGIRRFVTTPTLPGETNLISDRYEANILPDGGIEFELAREAVGQYASYFRQMYQEEKDRLNALSRAWGVTLPNIRISDIRFDDLRALEKPVRYGFKAVAPNYGAVDADGSIAFPGVIQRLYLTRRYGALSKRKYDLVLDFPWGLDSSIRFRLPPGYRVVSVPEDIRLETDFGKCRIAFDSSEPGSVIVRGSFSFDVSRVKVEQYEAFREFCRLVDEKRAEKIRIAK